MEHCGRLAGYSEQRDIDKAWRFFTAEALSWFTLMPRREYFGNLKRRQDVIYFHSRFTELARLVGVSPDSALHESRPWDVYYGRMTTQVQHTLSSVI